MSAFDFSTVESAKGGSFIEPGVHKLRVTKVEAGKYKTETPYLAITLSNSEDQTLTEKFILKGETKEKTEQALGRLQYFHEAWSGAKITKAFDTVDELVGYFQKCFINTKAGSRYFIVGGEKDPETEKVYSKLPYAEFILGKDGEEKVYEEDTPEYKKVVSVRKPNPETKGKSNGILNGEAKSVKGSGGLVKTAETAKGDDLPW